MIPLSDLRLFIDYQNVHLSVSEAFAPPGTPPHKTLIHPARFADTLLARRVQAGRGASDDQATAIHVYRGQPSPSRQPDAASANEAQAAEWTRDPRVKMHRRPLRYPRNWPQDKAKEKGVDVMLACDFVRAAIEQTGDTLIMASRDTDLVPALDMALQLGQANIEVATWTGCTRLRLPNADIWCTYLLGNDYVASKDSKKYWS